MFTKLFVVAALAAQVFASPFITFPVVGSSIPGGSEATITWIEGSSSTAPSLKDFGPSKISIYAGNAQQQTSLQLIDESLDVSKESSVKFTVDKSIGPDSDQYFIRIESLAFKDPAQPQYPALSFSAKFRLTGMTGAFSSAVQAQIAGQSTAPLQGPTAAPTTGTASATTAKVTSSGTTSAPAKATGTPAAAQNGALSVKASWVGVVIGAVVGITMF